MRMGVNLNECCAVVARSRGERVVIPVRVGYHELATCRGPLEHQDISDMPLTTGKDIISLSAKKTYRLTYLTVPVDSVCTDADIQRFGVFAARRTIRAQPEISADLPGERGAVEEGSVLTCRKEGKS